MQRYMVSLSFALWLVFGGWNGPKLAHADITDGPARRASEGLHLGTGVIVLMPTDDGPWGGGLQLQGRYGVGAGPLVVGPGAALSGYVISRRFVGTAMPTLRVTLPIAFIGPFVTGGVGGGWLSNPSEGGFAWSAGGGLLIHLGDFFAIGAEVSFKRIVGTEFEVLSIGPSLRFGG